MASLKSQKEAERDFDQQSFFILSDLPKGAEFGIDSLLWTVAKFGGVKFVPAGLHLFVFSAAPNSTDANPEAISRGVGLRHGLFRFFGEQQKFLVEAWNNVEEELVSDADVPKPKRRRALLSTKSESEQTVISPEYLKGIDSSLAPYPDTLSSQWKPLSNFVSLASLTRVVGIDERGNARVDAVMASVADEEELKSAGGRKTWGKEREADVETNLDEGDMEGFEKELLRFLDVDLKKSWPAGAVGEDLTRWSKDKSWCLSNAVATHYDGDVKELLAELQLSFVLFTLVHNYSSLASYKILFSLLCRSTSLLLPVPSRPLSTSPYSTILLTTPVLPLYASFLNLFFHQLSFLDKAFFSNEMPGLDLHLLAELEILCTSLCDAAPEWHKQGGPASQVWLEVVASWEKVSVIAMERFGWELGMIKGGRARKRAYEGKQLGSTATPRVRDLDEVDLEDLEDGEDAPVIVEM